MRQVHEDYGGDYGRLVDIERCGALFRDIAKAHTFVGKIRTDGIDGLVLRRFKDRLNKQLPSGCGSRAPDHAMWLYDCTCSPRARSPRAFLRRPRSDV